MIGVMDVVSSTALGEYLQARRRSLAPEAAGLIRAGRRRTPGLRREEVATLADVSVDHYERLERSRATNPSAPLIARLADALQLDPDETAYLYLLAGHSAPEPAASPGQVDPAMLFLLRNLEATPAHILDAETNVLAQNALSAELFGRLAGQPGRLRNMAWRWFTDPQIRAHSAPEECEEIGRGWTAELRSVVAEQSTDRAARLVADLLAASEEFASYWQTMAVYRFRTMRKKFTHPATGAIEVNCDMVLGHSGGARLMLLRPEPGTDVEQRLRKLHKEIEQRAG